MRAFWPQLIDRYAVALAERLGRLPEDIRGCGLGARDFNGTLDLAFADGSRATFHHAFFIHDVSQRAIVVFTEHCGYLVFPDWLRVVDDAGNILFNRLD